MKIGIISDIHSNIVALNEVLKEFERRNIDKIICSGDIIGIGPCPEEVIQSLMRLKEKLIVVKGNHEQYFLKGLPKQIHDNMRDVSLDELDHYKWVQSRITSKSAEYISKLPVYENIEIKDKKIHVIHYPMIKNKRYKKHIKNPTVEQSIEMFSEVDADIYIYGHTHTFCENNINNKLYINPGSLGCPMDTNIASCGILTIGNEDVKFEHLEIEYDVNEVTQEIKKLKYSNYINVLKLFYGKR